MAGFVFWVVWPCLPRVLDALPTSSGQDQAHGHDWSPQEDVGVGAFSMAVNLPISSILQQNSETMVFWLPAAEGPLVSRLCLPDTCVRKGVHPTVAHTFTAAGPACPSQSTGSGSVCWTRVLCVT